MLSFTWVHGIDNMYRMHHSYIGKGMLSSLHATLVERQVQLNQNYYKYWGDNAVKSILQFCQSLVFVERRWLTCTCELISTLTRVVKIVGVIFSLPLTLLRVNFLKTWFCWVPSLAKTVGWVACRRLIWVSCVLSFIELCDLDWVIWKNTCVVILLEWSWVTVVTLGHEKDFSSLTQTRMHLIKSAFP